ncbi:MAG: DsbE family thiol:disulfide interchange protein [Gammaproteobacteria bacterium]|nr:MAG: DsbE family thiol:disulfide interchange protein [Gammaproteobacteria bacterium]
MKKLIPFVLFMILMLLLYIGLSLDPKEVPSPFINKPAPEFATYDLYKNDIKISKQKMLGQVWLLNVFASWCYSCRAEHQVITEFTKNHQTVVIGLNYKDATEDAKEWLKQYGNPYDFVAVDKDGDIGIEYGVYGVPETFIIDKKGIVRHKNIGPVNRDSLQQTIIPLVKKLEAE